MGATADEQPALAHKLLQQVEKMHGELMRETRVKSAERAQAT